MGDAAKILPWDQPGWFEQAEDWIKKELGLRGIRVGGPIEQVQARPWSTVLCTQTGEGIFFFKASAPELAHEPGLTQALYRWHTDCLQTVLAVDLERSWMLMPDERPTLRTLIQTKADLGHWERILPLYAGLQRDLAGRKNDLLALGVLDRRLAGLPGQFERLLAERAALMVDQVDGLTGEQYRRLVDLVPRYAEMCARLSAYGIPETLHHDDFHDANIFVPYGRYAFSDWGESCVTHPFFTLLVTLRSIAYRLDLPYGSGEHDYQFAPELAQLRDLYLSQWAAYGSPEELRPAFSLAWRVAMVNRALTWWRVTANLAEEGRTKYASAVPAWLQEFLDSLSERARF